jgi:hypothetical protein
MSESGSDQEIVTETAQRKSSSRANDGPELSTDGAVSLFSTVLTNALEQQKINIIQHFESRFAKNEKQTGVEAGDFVFKHEGNRIQHSFNRERADKLAKVESLIKIKDLTAASKLLTEERGILRKRNRILKIADKHGWGTVQEYLDSPLADDKDDAANLRTAIARAATKRRSKPYDRPADRANISDKFASRGGAKFNARIFLRGFGQFNGDGSRGQQQQFVGKCFYCNQQGHYARCYPLKGTTATAALGASKEQTTKTQ